MDVIEDLADELWIGDIGNDTGVGTIARRMGELGAKTPWYRVRLTRGRGTSAARRVIKSWGLNRTWVVLSDWAASRQDSGAFPDCDEYGRWRGSRR
jgi:hypothetical protein